MTLAQLPFPNPVFTSSPLYSLGNPSLSLLTLPVKVKFNDRGPVVYLKSGNNAHRLDETTIHRLDKVDILAIDMDIRPYDWVLHEGTKKEMRGRTAYLDGMDVIQNISRFEERYAEEEYPN